MTLEEYAVLSNMGPEELAFLKAKGARFVKDAFSSDDYADELHNAYLAAMDALPEKPLPGSPEGIAAHYRTLGVPPLVREYVLTPEDKRRIAAMPATPITSTTVTVKADAKPTAAEIVAALETNAANGSSYARIALQNGHPSPDDYDESEPSDPRIITMLKSEYDKLQMRNDAWQARWDAVVVELAAMKARVAELEAHVLAEVGRMFGVIEPNPIHRALRFGTDGVPK